MLLCATFLLLILFFKLVIFYLPLHKLRKDPHLRNSPQTWFDVPCILHGEFSVAQVGSFDIWHSWLLWERLPHPQCAQKAVLLLLSECKHITGNEHVKNWLSEKEWKSACPFPPGFDVQLQQMWTAIGVEAIVQSQWHLDPFFSALNSPSAACFKICSILLVPREACWGKLIQGL